MTQSEIVGKLLKLYPKTRKSDKELIWFYWMWELNKDTININELRFCSACDLTKEDYEKLTSSDSITRAKRKLTVSRASGKI